MKMLTKTFFAMAAGFCLFSSQADAAVITKVNTTSGLFDASSGLRTFNFTIGESGGIISDVNIAIRFGKHDGETFGVNAGGTPFYNEIVFQLIGNTVEFGTSTIANLIDASSWSSGTGGFLDRTITFDEQASQVVNFSSEPLAGTYRTTGNGSALGLSQFNGLTLAAGDWTLFIQDTVGSDALDFISAELTINAGPVEPPASVPDGGSTVALLGFAMSAVAGARRKFGV
ncbi:MAG: motif [Verrucomicrobiota bacterium]|jgi:hypothetical protein